MIRPLVLALALLQAPGGPPAAPRRAFVGVHVADVVAGRARRDQTVLVSGDRITAVGPVDSVPVPPGTTRIEGRGRYLMPGLADLHAHFARPEDFDVYLANGVTTVQLLNASADLLPWRDSIAAGLRRGPRLTLCKGPISGVPDSARAARIVAEAAREGFRCIKIYDDVSLAAYHALVDEAHRRGMRALGHIPRNLTWENMLAVRPDAVAHAEEFLYSPIETAAAVDTIVTEMAARRISLITTIANYDLISRQLFELAGLLRDPVLAYASPVHRRAWGLRLNHYARDFKPSALDDLRRLLIWQRGLVRRLDSAGALVTIGTDTYNELVVPGFSVADELEQLVLAGLSPAAALRAGTANAAAALGEAGEWGVVAPGARADLVLVHGDPLRDVENARLIEGVMVRGVWHERRELSGWLDSLRAGYAFEERVMTLVDQSGVAAALALVDSAARRLGRPPIGAFALNELGWQLARLEHPPQWDAAIRVFEANARLFPDDPIAIGSLAEAREERKRGAR